MNTIFKTDFNLPGQISKYEGKVRDVYSLENDILVVIASDRISAFDIVMPKPIPFKGQVLNQISVDMLKSTEDIIQNWLISSPDPNVSIGRKLKPVKVEMVIRGYLSGHSDRLYSSGKRSICGVNLPNGLVSNQKFENPIIFMMFCFLFYDFVPHLFLPNLYLLCTPTFGHSKFNNIWNLCKFPIETKYKKQKPEILEEN